LDGQRGYAWLKINHLDYFNRIRGQHNLAPLGVDFSINTGKDAPNSNLKNGTETGGQASPDLTALRPVAIVL
jgi:hypothetical protein